MTFRPLIVAIACCTMLFWGCAEDLAIDDGYTWPCETNAECGAGYECREHPHFSTKVCVEEGSTIDPILKDADTSGGDVADASDAGDGVDALADVSDEDAALDATDTFDAADTDDADDTWDPDGVSLPDVTDPADTSDTWDSGYYDTGYDTGYDSGYYDTGYDSGYYDSGYYDTWP